MLILNNDLKFTIFNRDTFCRRLRLDLHKATINQQADRLPAEPSESRLQYVKPDTEVPTRLAYRVIQAPPGHTRGLRGDRRTNNTKLSARSALTLLDLPNIKDELKIRDPENLQQKMTNVLSIDVSDTKNKLMDLSQESLSQGEKNAITETIRNLDIIKSLQDSKAKGDNKAFAKHLAIASGYISQQIEIPLTAMTDENTDDLELSMQAAAHMVCWLEHAAFSVGNLDRTDGAEETPKNIAIKMQVVNKQTNSILKQIQNIQKKNAHQAVPWMRKWHIPRNNKDKVVKKQWIQETLRFGLDSPICKELHLTEAIKQSVDQIKAIDPEKQSSTFFITDDYDTEDLKNWHQADKLAVLIASRKTLGDQIHYHAQSKYSNTALRWLMKVIDTFDRFSNHTQSELYMDHRLHFNQKLSVAKAIDICDEKFDTLLDKKLAASDLKSAESVKLKRLKEVRERLKTIDFSQAGSHDEIKNAWWFDNVTLFSKLNPQIPNNWGVLGVRSSSPVFVRWLNEIFNELDRITLSEMESKQENLSPSITTTKPNPEKYKKSLSPNERAELTAKGINNMKELGAQLESFYRLYKNLFGDVVGELDNLAYRDNQWYWQANSFAGKMGINIASMAKEFLDVDLDPYIDWGQLSDEALQKKQILIESINEWTRLIILLCYDSNYYTERNLEQISRLEETIKKNA